MLTYADVCWHLNYSQPWKDPVMLQHFDLRAAGVLLTYADVVRRMLTYADGC
jgi:hypothetical protein